MNKTEIVEKAKDMMAKVPVLFLAIKHKQTPVLAKIIALLAVSYALSPVDLVPDFIPVLGALDDLLIVPLLAAWAIKLIPPGVWQECTKQAENLWENGKPKKWYYALPVVIFWLLILFLAAKAVFKI